MCSLFRVLNIIHLVLEDGQYCRNRYHILTGPIKFTVIEGKTFVSINMIFYNGMKLTKKRILTSFLKHSLSQETCRWFEIW